jgi:hypothetical protein
MNHSVGVMGRLSTGDAESGGPALVRFFASHNNTMARTLADVNESKIMSQADMATLGLDPNIDAAFIRALALAQCPPETKLSMPKCFGLCC